MDTKRRIKDILRGYRPPLSNEQIDELVTKILEVIELKKATTKKVGRPETLKMVP